MMLFMSFIKDTNSAAASRELFDSTIYDFAIIINN